jgi:hypothetical protein
MVTNRSGVYRPPFDANSALAGKAPTEVSLCLSAADPSTVRHLTPMSGFPNSSLLSLELKGTRGFHDDRFANAPKPEHASVERERPCLD